MTPRSLRTRLIAGALLVLPLAAAAQDARTTEDGAWHFGIAPYLWTAGLKGDVSFEGLPRVPVDASFSDVWSNLDFALLGRFEGRKDRWGFGTDLVYINLGAVASPELGGGRIEIDADMRTLITEGFAFRRLGTFGGSGATGYVDLLAGARYVGTRQELIGNQFQGSRRTVDWVDGVVGVRAALPFSEKVGLAARGDVAGLGSKLSWQLQGLLTVELSQRWLLAAGYRHLDIEYDEGAGLQRELFDASLSGPLFGFQYAW